MLREQCSVQIPDSSANLLVQTDWYNEQQFVSKEPVFIHGFLDGKLRGELVGHLIIERDVNENEFLERTRYVKLNDVSVHQLKDEKMKRRGLGISMVHELEKMGRQFGAAKIVGTISASDLENQPWLPKFYKQLGFEVIKNGGGYNLEKLL